MLALEVHASGNIRLQGPDEIWSNNSRDDTVCRLERVTAGCTSSTSSIDVKDGRDGARLMYLWIPSFPQWTGWYSRE